MWSFGKNKKLLFCLGVLLILFSFHFFVANVLAEDPAPTPTPTADNADNPTADTSSTAGMNPITGSAKSYLIEAVNFIINLGIKLFGALLTLLMEVVIFLSVYNKFIDNPYVSEGWIILRDLVNMFFVLGLLFIAFATVLKIEKYSWNKLLARLLIMAILVNFSKTIVGLIIDFFQVVMITFVNAYRDITAGNIFKGLVMADWMKIGGTANIDWEQGLTAVTATAMALIFTIVSCIVILIFVVILAFRIVALWALTVFSPLAFLAWVFQGSGGTVGNLANTWWKQFLNYCMIGPFLAFFLWLSVISMVKLNWSQLVTEDQYSAEKRKVQVLPNAATAMDATIAYIMGIIMLVAGLSFSQQFAVAGSSLAGKTANRMKNAAEGLLDRTARGSYGLAAGVVGGAVGAATFLPRKGYERVRRAAGAYVGGAYEGLKQGIVDSATARKLPGTAGGVLAAMTEKGAKQERDMIAGRARSWLGPRKKAKETAQLPVIKDLKDQMEEEINWENKDDVNKFVGAAIGSGNFLRAKAALEKVHEKKMGENKHVEDFKGRFMDDPSKNITGRQYSGPDDLSWIEFSSQLEKKGEDATGRAYAYNKYFVDEGGNAMPIEDWSAHDQIMTEYGQKNLQKRKDVADDKTAFDIRGAQDSQEKENRASHILAAARDSDNFGNYTKAGRKNFLESAQFLVSSAEGRNILDGMLDKGLIDEDNLNDLEKGIMMSNAEYTSEINGTVVGGKSKANLSRYLNKDQKNNINQIKTLHSKTKRGMNRNLAEAGVVSGIGNIDTSSMDKIVETLPAVSVDSANIMVDQATPDGKALYDRLNTHAGKVGTERDGIVEDAKIVNTIETFLANNPKAEEKDIKAEIKKVAPTNAEAKFREFKQRKLSKDKIQERARKFVVKYGDVDAKNTIIVNSVKSDAYDTSMAEMDTMLDNITAGRTAPDVGDMGRLVEEITDIEDQTQSQFKRSVESQNFKLDPSFDKDNKRTKSLIDAFKRAKEPDQKANMLLSLKDHLQAVKAKREKAGPGSDNSYLKNEYELSQIRKAMGPGPDQFNGDLVAKVQKLMKEKSDVRYSEEKVIQDFIEKAKNAD